MSNLSGIYFITSVVGGWVFGEAVFSVWDLYKILRYGAGDRGWRSQFVITALFATSAVLLLVGLYHLRSSAAMLVSS